MRKRFGLLLIPAILASSVASQTVTTSEELYLKVNKILLNKDLRSFSDELAENHSDKVEENLLSLDVFARLKQHERIKNAVIRLSEAKDLPRVANRGWLLEIVRRAVGNDVNARRLYYERLTGDDGYYHTSTFIRDWEQAGDSAALDAWLAKRATPPGSWFRINLERNIRSKTVQPIFDGLAAKVRNNPQDREALANYISAIRIGQEHEASRGGNAFETETDWLHEVFVPNRAREAYDLGVLFESVNPRLAIKYYQYSLKWPVTEEEAITVLRSFVTAVPAQRMLDGEKQLRYWTKERLAAAYQRTGQSSLAQPIMEELLAQSNEVAVPTDYALAGAVQSGSGARAVESKVLQDEATRSPSFGYWWERIRYYMGRNEPELVVQAFREGLSKISEKARFIDRFKDSYSFTIRTRESELPQLRQRLELILLDEFRSVATDSDVAYSIAQAASSDGFNLRGLQNELFVRRRDVLPRLLAKKAEWGNGESDLIRQVLRDEKLSAEQKLNYLSELERIVNKGALELRLSFSDVLDDIGEHERRIPLLLYCIKHAPIKGDDNIWLRNYSYQELFEAYVNTGKWQMAEKLLADQQTVFLPYWGLRFERLAISAARQNAAAEALRIWLKAVNFVGHSSSGLLNFADTPSRNVFRDYYRQMKANEPGSEIADAALKFFPQ
jgi:hypothetical protein